MRSVRPNSLRVRPRTLQPTPNAVVALGLVPPSTLPPPAKAKFMMILGASHATCYFRCHQASIGHINDFGAARLGEALTATFRGKKEAGKQAQAAKGIKMLRKGCKNIEVLILKAHISLLESNCWCLEKVRYQSLVAPSLRDGPTWPPWQALHATTR